MSTKFFRVYKPLDLRKVQEHLLIYGDLSGQCANCQNMDLKLNVVHCPNCRTDFKYLAFRNIKQHLPKLHDLNETRLDLTIIDFDDYSKAKGAQKAEDLFK